MASRARVAFITNGGAGMTIKIPHHVAIVMDGNGRWAQQRGLPRTAGHEAGEAALFDVVEGAIEYGVKELVHMPFQLKIGDVHPMR
jgi:undecaprenyl pyrophosphate synthase